MPERRPHLASDSIYHIFNRGVEKRVTFSDQSYYKHFLQTLLYYQTQPPVRLSWKREESVKAEKLHDKLVEILGFCLMTNHFHLLLKQLIDGGITKFMSNIANSYTRYFNTRQERGGPLFQGIFKAKLIESQDSFWQVSRYIHLNPQDLYPTTINTHLEGVEAIRDYHYSSYNVYLGKLDKYELCRSESITEFVPTPSEYQEFVEAKIGMDSRTGIEELILD
mgnify:CR=1 FL=1